MTKSADITFIGVALVDSIIKGFDPEPISASGYRAASGTLAVGGEAVNGSMAAAKLGLRTRILCSLGTDAAGDMVSLALERSGADISAIIRDPEHPTPVTTMFVRDDGSRKSITNQAHRYNFHPERCPEALAGTRAVVLGSLFRAPFDDPAVIRQVLTAAAGQDAASRAEGSAERQRPLILADTKLPNFVPLSLDDIRESLPLIDYIFPNEDKANYYSGKDDPQAMADVFLSYGVTNVVIKLGAKGCLLKNADGCLRLEALPIRAVDATGAGDTFLTGFAAEKLAGRSDAEALRFANACGAICTTAVGASAALKDRAQVEALLTSGEDR